ncbi:hypothetical protein [Alkalibacillus haloalkaliphilus]|nr:hypothetical protein [Alkalibacillus haloalkaliphilus]MDV2580738.1 hypothetical protein [Alkalibacillus haloalkaliphilus]
MEKIIKPHIVYALLNSQTPFKILHKLIVVIEEGDRDEKAVKEAASYID